MPFYQPELPHAPWVLGHAARKVQESGNAKCRGKDDQGGLLLVVVLAVGGREGGGAGGAGVAVGCYLDTHLLSASLLCKKSHPNKPSVNLLDY